jgi:hypothetical protein
MRAKKADLLNSFICGAYKCTPVERDFDGYEKSEGQLMRWGSSVGLNATGVAAG